MLNVLIPCCKHDQHLAVMLLEWIAEMGRVDAPMFLLCDSECSVQHLMELSRMAFTNVKHLRDYENIKSDWSSDKPGAKSAAGPNSLFRQAVWHFAGANAGPWLFLEPDAIPCRPDWLTLLDKQYHEKGKPFMGFLVSRETHPGVTAQHMSGVAVYPANSPAYFRKHILSSPTAFDIATAEAVLPQMHNTELIFHRYRPPTFDSKEDFEQRVPSGLALYHAVKDGSIYSFLRKRLKGGDQSCEHHKENSNTVKKSPDDLGRNDTVTSKLTSNGAQTFDPNAAPIVDIYIKTRPHDYPWLEWCLKSVGYKCWGFRRVILDSPEPVPRFSYFKDWVDLSADQHIPDKEPGYLYQQVCKLNADQKTDAEWILYTDSDCVFTRNVTPSDFIKDGKPIWLYTPLDKARPDQHVWFPVMEKFLGRKPEHEFMRRHPFCVQRWMLEEFRKFTQYRHGKSIEDYIMSQADPNNGLALRFSEWNCLGFFLWEFHRDKVAWTLDADAPPACTYQGFTHGGEQRKQEDLAKFREILDTPALGVVHNTAGEVPVAPPPLTEDAAISFLADNVRDNAHKGRIIRKLKKQWEGKGAGVVRKNKKVVAMASGFLLAIHSYPGANDTFGRHWDNFVLSGASRIVGIGTTDGGCRFGDSLDPLCESVNIGENAYMKLKGKDDHLCRRLLDTVKWCLTQPEDKFVICEYDTVFLRPFPDFTGINACQTGGRVNGSKGNQFHHNPWAFDRASGEKLIAALESVLPECQEYPDNSPDLFFGYAMEKSGIEVRCEFKMFTRNTIEGADIELARGHAELGTHVIHGVKTKEAFDAITSANLVIAA